MDLPEETIVNIFLQSDLMTLLSFCQTDKKMARICQDNQIWKEKYIHDFGHYLSSIGDQDCSSWKEKYKQTWLNQWKVHLDPLSQTPGDTFGIIDKANHLSLFRVEDQKIIEQEMISYKDIISVSSSHDSILFVTKDGNVYGKGSIDLNLDGRMQVVNEFSRLPIEKVRKVSHSGPHYLFLLKTGQVLINGTIELFPKAEKVHYHKIMDLQAIDVVVTYGKVVQGMGFYYVVRYGIIDSKNQFYYFGSQFVYTPDIPHLLIQPIRLPNPPFKGINITNDGQIKIKPERIQIPSIRNISFGLNHAVLLDTNRQIYVWGMNTLGQLGANDPDVMPEEILYISPNRLSYRFPSPIAKITAGLFNSAVITEDGRLFIWGEMGNLISIEEQMEGDFYNHQDETGFYTPTEISLHKINSSENIMVENIIIGTESLGHYYSIIMDTKGNIYIFS